VRRLAPRSLEAALATVTAGLAPATTLSRVQAAWRGAVGERVEAEAHPIAERDGIVTVACRDSVWAQELDLMGRDLVDSLNDELERGGSARSVHGLRCKVGA
jgi:hypothetical protein